MHGEEALFHAPLTLASTQWGCLAYLQVSLVLPSVIKLNKKYNKLSIKSMAIKLLLIRKIRGIFAS
jgi:hypothetical protein